MEMPWAMREAFVSRIHEIDTGNLIGCAGMHSFVWLFGLRRGRKEDIESIINLFDELNQKQYKKKVIDIAVVASVDSKMKHSFKILEL